MGKSILKLSVVMWFKQTTCDACYTPLEDIGRHNKYYFSKVLDFRKLSAWEFQLNSAVYKDWLNYDTSPYCRNGWVYCYKIEPLTPQGL